MNNTMKPLLILLLGVCLLACGNKSSDKRITSGEKELILQDSVADHKTPLEQKPSRPEPMEKFLKIKWMKIVETPGEDKRLPIAAPLVRNGLVFPNTAATHAFNAYTGEKLYYSDPKSRDYLTRYVEDSLLLFQTDDLLTIQNIYTGSISSRHRQNFFYRQNEAPKFLNNPFILTAEDDVLKLIDIREGKVIAEHRFKSKLIGNYIVTDDIIYFTDKETQYFMEFDGTIVDSLSLGKMDSNPILNEGTIYAFIDNLGLVAIDADKQNVKWSSKNDWFDATLFVRGDTLYANHGCISAYNKNLGIPLWEMDCQDEEIIFTSQLVPFGNKFIGFLEGFSNVPRIGVVNSDGIIEYFKWSNTDIFNIQGEYDHGPRDPEDPNFGPEMMLSDIYDNMIFGQYNNVLVGFEIISPDQGE